MTIIIRSSSYFIFCWKTTKGLVGLFARFMDNKIILLGISLRKLCLWWLVLGLGKISEKWAIRNSFSNILDVKQVGIKCLSYRSEILYENLKNGAKCPTRTGDDQIWYSNRQAKSQWSGKFLQISMKAFHGLKLGCWHNLESYQALI